MNRLAAYTAGGGFVPAAERAPGMLSDIALRAAGGGLAAAPVGYVVTPEDAWEDVGTVAGIGAAVPVVTVETVAHATPADSTTGAAVIKARSAAAVARADEGPAASAGSRSQTVTVAVT